MENLWIIVLLHVFILPYSAFGFEILCHHSDGIERSENSTADTSEYKSSLMKKDHILGTVTEDGKYILCNRSSRHVVCFAVWRKSKNDTLIMKKQSCMLMRDEMCRQKKCGRSVHSPHARLEYCCCSGRLCNKNVHLAITVERPKSSLSIHEEIYETFSEEPNRETHAIGFTNSSLALILGITASGVLLCVGTIFILLILRYRRAALKANGSRPLRMRKSNGGIQNGRLTSASDDSCGTTSTRLFSNNGARQRISQGKLLGDFSRLQLIDLIHRGKYGDVWKSKMPSIENSSDGNEDIYCVKTFSRGPQQQYFQNERDIYSMPMNCNHPNILSCLGWDVRPADGLGMLVLEYCPYGSLQSYLINHEVDWQSFLRLSMGAAAGLAHMHSEFGVPGVTQNLSQVVTWTSGDRKCPIVHRDVNSRNMVVRRDGTLLISDMGFAVKLAPGGNRYYNRDNQAENAEEFPLQEVGTVRYMAPEVLEGFVNLRECESSLKQVDVYALALVLWEIAMRCSCLFPSRKASQYMEPYWQEVGPQPDVSVLTEIVVKQKLRPRFPQDWCLTQMPHRLLRDTLEESWDSDQEARLSAACILERLKSLGTKGPFSNTARNPEEPSDESTPFLNESSELRDDAAQRHQTASGPAE